MLLYFSVESQLFLFCISTTTMRIHVLLAAASRFALHLVKTKRGRARERASERCMPHEWVPRHRTAGRTLHPPAPRSPCGCADWRGTLREPAADEPGQHTLAISSTWPFHPTRNHTTGSATVSAGYSGRAEAHGTRQLCSHYDTVFTYRWTQWCVCTSLCASIGHPRCLQRHSASFSRPHR